MPGDIRKEVTHPWISKFTKQEIQRELQIGAAIQLEKDAGDDEWEWGSQVRSFCVTRKNGQQHLLLLLAVEKGLSRGRDNDSWGIPRGGEGGRKGTSGVGDPASRNSARKREREDPLLALPYCIRGQCHSGRRRVLQQPALIFALRFSLSCSGGGGGNGGGFLYRYTAGPILLYALCHRDEEEERRKRDFNDLRMGEGWQAGSLIGLPLPQPSSYHGWTALARLWGDRAGAPVCTLYYRALLRENRDREGRVGGKRNGNNQKVYIAPQRGMNPLFFFYLFFFFFSPPLSLAVFWVLVIIFTLFSVLYDQNFVAFVLYSANCEEKQSLFF